MAYDEFQYSQQIPSLTVVNPSQSLTTIQHHLGSLLTQIMVSHRGVSQDALLNIARSLGEAFLGDCCLIAADQVDQAALPYTCWSANPTCSCPLSLKALLDFLNHSAIASHWSDPALLKISDVWSLTQSSESRVATLSGVVGSSTLTIPLEMVGFRSILAVRTPFYKQTSGIIFLARSQPHPWTEAEVHLLKTLSDQVAIAISQAQLEQQVDQQIRYQTLLNQITCAIRNVWDLDQIFQLATEGTASALQVSRGLVLMLKYSNPLPKNRLSEWIPRAKATVECEFSGTSPAPSPGSTQAPDPLPSSKSGQRSPKQSFWVSECSLLRQVLSEQAESIVISAFNQLTENGDHASTSELDLAPIFDPQAMPALLLMPLENQGTVLGCLVLQHHHPRSWQPEEITFVKLVAAQLSTAIIQTQTLRQVHALVDERTAQLQKSLEVQAKLYEKTRQQVDQLRYLAKRQEEFLSTVSHELLTPLTSMTLAIRMLRQAKLSPERQAKYLDILEQQCVQETNLINDLLGLQKLESGQAYMRLQPIDLRYPVRDLVQSFQSNWADKELTVEFDLPTRPLYLQTDPDSLNRILSELFTNAGKYAANNTPVSIKISHQVKTVDCVAISLTNWGAGITPTEMPHIFDKFSRGEGVTQQAIPGTGLGLALVKGLVEHLSGEIVASSQPLANSKLWETCFTLTLPQMS